MSEGTYATNVLIGISVIAVMVGAGIGYGGAILTDSDDSSGRASDVFDSSSINATLKVGFIYVGPQGDIGWTAAHDLARQMLDDKYDWLKTNFIESVPEGDAMSSIDFLVQDWGADVVITTSFGFMDQTIEAGLKYPNQMFFHVSGFKRAANVGTIFADFYQLYYLNGLIAAALSETGEIGYVAAFPIAELRRHINAFQMGARLVDPDIKTNVRWIFDWFNPTAADTATTELINSGSDVIGFTEDTDATVLAASREGAFAFSHYSPMQVSAPSAVPSGQLVHWEVLYETLFQKIFLQEYTNTNLANVDILGLLKEGAVELGGAFGVPINPLFETRLKAVSVTHPLFGTLSVYDMVLAMLASMSQTNVGFDPYTGPLYDQNGNLVLGADQRMSIGDLLSIEWFIGVEGGCSAVSDAGCVVGSPTG